MKIKFITSPLGRDYKAGDVVEFNGPIEEGYARKYLDRGWAEPADKPAVVHVEKVAAVAEAAVAREAKENAAYAAAVARGERGPKVAEKK